MKIFFCLSHRATVFVHTYMYITKNKLILAGDHIKALEIYQKSIFAYFKNFAWSPFLYYRFFFAWLIFLPLSTTFCVSAKML